MNTDDPSPEGLNTDTETEETTQTCFTEGGSRKKVSPFTGIQDGRFTNLSSLASSIFGSVKRAEDTKTNMAVAIKISQKVLMESHRAVQGHHVNEDIRTEAAALRRLFPEVDEGRDDVVQADAADAEARPWQQEVAEARGLNLGEAGVGLLQPKSLQSPSKRQHPGRSHVACLVAEFEDDMFHYLVTNFASRGELFTKLHKEGRLPEEECRRIFRQLVLAVAWVHSQGVVHLDLSLENVLLDGHGIVKVIDFGLARLSPHKLKGGRPRKRQRKRRLRSTSCPCLRDATHGEALARDPSEEAGPLAEQPAGDEESAQSRVGHAVACNAWETGPVKQRSLDDWSDESEANDAEPHSQGMFDFEPEPGGVGKMQYMAPELYAGEPFDGAKADMWSLGVILFALLTGSMPFQEPSVRDPWFKVIHCGRLAHAVKSTGHYSKLLCPTAVDLLTHILAPASKRISLGTVLAHPWLAEDDDEALPLDLLCGEAPCAAAQDYEEASAPALALASVSAAPPTACSSCPSSLTLESDQPVLIRSMSEEDDLGRRQAVRPGPARSLSQNHTWSGPVSSTADPPVAGVVDLAEVIPKKL